MVVGDIHGNLPAALILVKKAVHHEAEVIIQCGDFGLWPGYEGIQYLDSLNESLRQTNRNMIFVDGNHEDFNQLDWYDAHNPRSIFGQVYLRSNILHSPRGNSWTWGKKRFMTVGGAVSIDKEYRTEGKSWWPQEQLTYDQARQIIMDVEQRRRDGKRDVDYLFTHDCSDRTPFRDRMKPDLDSRLHRKQMDTILASVQPKMHFHGHMHTKYEWENPVVGSGIIGDESTVYTKTYGLEADGMFWNWGILDTETDVFVFAPTTPSG